jgi:protein involved in polysaccharide export with SLBB domain
MITHPVQSVWKSRMVTLLVALCLSGIFIAATQAQGIGSSADKLDAWKRALEELRQAEREVSQQQLSGTAPQRELDKMAEERARIDREMQYARSKLNTAVRELAVFSRTGPQAEIDKWQREVVAWEERLKGAQTELEELDIKTQTVVQDIQRSLFEGPQSPLILPGESLQLFVLEDESFNGLYQVREGGYVILPRVGRVGVAGKDIAAVEKAIKDALELTQLRQATVMIERARGVFDAGSGNVIYLAGEFNTPGPMRIAQGTTPTIVTIILRSGGLTTTADLSKVKLLRLESGKPLVEEVDVQAILEGTGLQSDLALNAGDIVVVPAYAPVIYITGNVRSPGVLKLFSDETLTAYSAILRSGGFARFANLRKVYVVRDRGNGEKVKIPININEVMAGKTADVVLQGLDIVVVPEKFFSW